MKLKTSILLALAVLSLIVAGLACNLPVGRAEPTPSPIPVSTQAVEEMVTQVVAAATQAAAGGPITLEFTEEQLTSAAALELQNQNDYDVRNIQVRLRDGLIRITGDYNQSGFSLPLEISMRVTPDGNGMAKADVVDAKIGPLPLPDTMVSQIEDNFNQVIQSELTGAGNNIRVDSITVADGKLTIQAHSQ